MEGKVLWEHEESGNPYNGTAQLVLTKDDRLTPEYELIVDGGDTAEPHAHSVTLERAHLAGLWLAILEQSDDLTWASTAMIQEAAIRCVMKIRACSREDATKLMKGEKL